MWHHALLRPFKWLINPQCFYHFAVMVEPFLWFGFGVLVAYGTLHGLYIVPPDYLQGDGFRIIYIHVPAAFSSLLIYSLCACLAFVGLVWRVKLAFVMMQAALALGAMFTALALISGCIWAKPMWGTWWIWDARLTSELILFFIYIGLGALHHIIPHQERADQAVAILTLVGVLNIPIIHFSVDWWFTLHQGATLAKFSSPSMHIAMRYPIYAVIIGFFIGFLSLLLLRTRTAILDRYRHTQWVQRVMDESHV